MSGSYSDLSFDPSFGGMIPSHGVHHAGQYIIKGISGSISVREPIQYPRIDEDELWNRMYVRPKPVIIMCGFCKSHNAVTNPTCVQCGAPMGYGIERVYG